MTIISLIGIIALTESVKQDEAMNLLMNCKKSFTNRQHLVCCLVFISLNLSYILSQENSDPISPEQPEGQTEAAQIARSRGFVAEEHKLVTSDGYILTLVRILNPLINNGHSGKLNKRPILFVPGESAVGSFYLAGSDGIEPKDLSDSDINDPKFRESLASEPSSGVLALLSSIFGHEVWILNRRATSGSLGHTLYKAYKNNNSTLIGATSVPVSDRCTANNPESGDYDTNEELLKILEQYGRESIDSRYWNYTLDQQARIDLPLAFDYVQAITGQDKLALVGYSSGASMILMMLIVEPKFNHMVSNAILLAPSFYRSPTASFDTNSVGRALSKYIGPFNGKSHITKQIQCLLKRACHQTYGRTRCDPSNHPATERIGNRPTTTQELMQYAGESRSTRQILQLQQNIGRPMHRFNFGSSATNFAAYGQRESPVYEIANIDLKTISIWHGPFDATANENEINHLVRSFKVPIEEHNFNESNLYFDHSSIMFHREVNTLINIPILERIEQTIRVLKKNRLKSSKFVAKMHLQKRKRPSGMQTRERVRSSSIHFE